MVNKTRLTQIAGRWLPFLTWMGLIFIMSGQPKSDIPSFGFWDTLVKKTAHFLAYAILSRLALRVTEGGKRPYLWAFVATAVYAVTDEYHQTLTPGRHGHVLDVLIDCAGGLAALLTKKARSGKS